MAVLEEQVADDVGRAVPRARDGALVQVEDGVADRDRAAVDGDARLAGPASEAARPRRVAALFGLERPPEHGERARVVLEDLANDRRAVRRVEFGALLALHDCGRHAAEQSAAWR